MQVSIKVVVATLIAVVALCALLLAFTPLVYFAHNEAMSFVLEAAEGAADQAQYVLNSKLNALRKLGDVLHKAAQRSDLIAELQPWQLVQWAGATAVAQDWSVLLFRPDNRGFIVTAYKTVGAGGVSIPGYVYLVNLSNPGTSVLSGFFGLHAPHTPFNQTSAPWIVGVTTLRYSTQPVGVILIQANRPLSAEWIGVTALRPTTTSVFALLTYGGPVHAGDDPSNPQYLAVSMRSTAFSNYMKNMSVSSSGSIILFDLVTRSLVAGSITDSSAIFTNNGTTPQLNLLRNLQDPKVASVLHAEYSDDQGEATGDSGLHMITTCATPCTFVFWPHSNTLRSGPFSSVFNIDVLVRSFVVVRVLQVSGSDDPDAEVSSSAAMNLRLMATVPSDDVVGAWINATHESLLFSVA
ncbi:transmembrane protein, putative, partial [Bodo saltans]